MEHKIKSIQDLILTETLTIYDENYEPRVHHDNIITPGQFTGLTFTADFPIYDLYYQKHFNIDGSTHIVMHNAAVVRRNHYNCFRTIIITKDVLSDIIKSKNNDMVYQTDGYAYVNPHHKIPMTIHFTRVNKLCVVVSKYTTILTENDGCLIFNALCKRRNQLDFD